MSNMPAPSLERSESTRKFCEHVDSKCSSLTEPYYSLISNSVTWCSNNVEGAYKRGVTIGIVIGWGNLQGVVSFNIQQKK